MSSEVLTGGDKIMKALQDIAEGMGGGSVSVGFMSGATYPDGTPVAAVAFWNEYGHGGKFPAPPRPFFRTMIAEESPTWPDKMAKLAKSTNYDGGQVLSLMGEDIKGGLQQSINNLTAPALSKTTLQIKKWRSEGVPISGKTVAWAAQLVKLGLDDGSGQSSKPLIDTGHMLNSVTYEVNA